MKKTKKMLISALTIVLAVILTMSSAFACTMLYVGSDLTETGDTYMSRSEDYSNSYNKIAYVSPAGKHPAGSTYSGCYMDFTFTHDSYAYTAVSDDNVVGDGNPTGECPNCGKTHEHSPMEEGGTNEKGLSVSAMDSVYANEAVVSADPLKSEFKGDTNFVSEGDMNTILLGECATAKEAATLLCSLYDQFGVNEGAGVQVSDKNETWYIENYSGSQYIAIKLSPVTVAFNANVGVIGLVDLDDTDNVMYSEDVIAVAKEAGTYVGDEGENTIDFRASYSSPNLNSRAWNGLNYLCGADTFTKETTTPNDITITNVKDGEIVPVYSNVQLKGKFTTQDMVDFYKVSTIGKNGNLEWHIFQIDSDADLSVGTIEWQGINHGGYSVAIPYFPTLTTDVYEGYKVGGIGRVSFVTELSDDATSYYPATKTDRKTGIVTEGFNLYPSGWETGVYWTNDLLSNYVESSAGTAEMQAFVKAQLAVMQQKCYDKAAEMLAAIPAMSIDEAKVYATAESKALAKEAHELAVALYKEVALGEHTEVIEPAVAATCTTAGSTEGSHCLACGKTLKVSAVVPATGHSYKDGKCTVCGAADPGYKPPVKLTDIDDINPDFKEAIEWAAQIGVTTGYEDGTFRPNAVCTRGQVVTFLWRLAGSPELASLKNPFSDVKTDSPYFKAILWASEQGITTGYEDGSFRPDAQCTRAHVVTFLWRFEDKPVVETEAKITDLAGLNADFAAAIKWAASLGITAGYEDGSFRPNAVCTRAHIVTFLYRYALIKATNLVLDMEFVMAGDEVQYSNLTMVDYKALPAERRMLAKAFVCEDDVLMLIAGVAVTHTDFNYVQMRMARIFEHTECT